MARQEEMSDFDALPWCKSIITTPGWTPLASRGDNGNALFSRTLWTPETFRARLALYKGAPSPSCSATGQLRILLSIGHGMDGWPGMCHGGVVSLIFDDVVQELTCAEMGGTTATAHLEIDFKKPVRTPGVVLCQASMPRPPEGRKGWVRATIEDGEGTVLAAADGMVVSIQGKL